MKYANIAEPGVNDKFQIHAVRHFGSRTQNTGARPLHWMSRIKQAMIKEKEVYLLKLKRSILDTLISINPFSGSMVTLLARHRELWKLAILQGDFHKVEQEVRNSWQDTESYGNWQFCRVISIMEGWARCKKLLARHRELWNLARWFPWRKVEQRVRNRRETRNSKIPRESGKEADYPVRLSKSWWNS